MRLRQSRRAVVVFLGCAVFAACGGKPVLTGNPYENPGADDVLLTVHNNDFRDAVIYAYWNGFKDRVGMVTGTTSKTFRMKWKSEYIQLQVDFIGSQADQVSGQIDVTQGDHLDYVILGQAR